MPFSHITHHMEKIPGSDLSAVQRITPIVRVSSYGETINIQGGQFWTDAGQRVENPPGWVYEEMSKMTPLCLREAGFPNGAPARPEGVAETPAPMLACKVCEKMVPHEHMAAHMAKHDRKGGERNQTADRE